jgi:hypothetical protein
VEKFAFASTGGRETRSAFTENFQVGRRTGDVRERYAERLGGPSQGLDHRNCSTAMAKRHLSRQVRVLATTGENDVKICALRSF